MRHIARLWQAQRAETQGGILFAFLLLFLITPIPDKGNYVLCGKIVVGSIAFLLTMAAPLYIKLEVESKVGTIPDDQAHAFYLICLLWGLLWGWQLPHIAHDMGDFKAYILFLALWGVPIMNCIYRIRSPDSSTPSDPASYGE